MVLQSSGAISLLNIQNEFGGANPIGLNEYYRGGSYVTANNTNVPTSGQISLSNFYGAFRSTNWFVTLGGTGEELGYKVKIDGSSNVYVAGYQSSSSNGGLDFYVAKYDPNGNILWQKSLGSTSSDYFIGIELDDLSNVYAVGYSSSNLYASVMKLNSSGTLQWQRSLGTIGSVNGITTDFARSVYICITSSPANIITAKYDTNGVLQWQRAYGGIGSEVGGGIATDSSANVYVVGRTSTGGIGGHDAVILKYNSNGALQWQRTIGTGFFDAGVAVAIDGSSNICTLILSVTSGSGNYGLYVTKHNTSGTLQWQRQITPPSLTTGSMDAGGIAVDSSNNIYITGSTNGVTGDIGSSDGYIAKYNSSGTIQWQRGFGSTVGDYFLGCTVDSIGNYYAVGYTGNPTNLLILKVPQDGSKTGTYGSFTYQARTLTEQAGALTSLTSTLSEGAASLTAITPTYTDAARSLTSTVTTI